MPKITIALNPKFHDKAEEEVEVNDILWMSGKSYIEGCNVTLRDRRILKSTNSTSTIRLAIDLAKLEDNEPCRG